jgi:hypothetical protein
MGAGRVKFSNDIGNRVSHARNLPQAVLGHEPGQRLGDREQAFRRARIGAQPIGIAAAERAAAAKLQQQFGNRGCVELSHREAPLLSLA